MEYEEVLKELMIVFGIEKGGSMITAMQCTAAAKGIYKKLQSNEVKDKRKLECRLKEAKQRELLIAFIEKLEDADGVIIPLEIGVVIVDQFLEKSEIEEDAFEVWHEAWSKSIRDKLDNKSKQKDPKVFNINIDKLIDECSISYAEEELMKDLTRDNLKSKVEDLRDELNTLLKEMGRK